MKVLIQNRPDAFEVFGGDSVQTLKTAEYLRKLGAEVDVSLKLAPDLSDYDIVHLMNTTRVTFTHAQLLNAKRQCKRTVLSPIYWNTRRVMSAYLRTPFFDVNFQSWKQLANTVLSSLVTKRLFNETDEFMHSRKLIAEVLSEVDCILPNSNAELAILRRDFSKSFKKKQIVHSVVPNGVDAQVFYNASPEKFVEKFGIRDFVLNVGRFSYRKNQAALIKAVEGLGLNVIFLGGSSISSNYYGVKDTIDKIYFEKCMRMVDSSFKFLPAIPHEETAAAYAACKVFVLPSLYETPGLSALEAALAGANICVTSGGSTHEYFSDLAVYCEPCNVKSIREGVLRAYYAPKKAGLREHVLRNFTWEKTAEATLKAYEKVLQK